MNYRTFTRTRWMDYDCTIPGMGVRHYQSSTFHETEEGARAACETYNRNNFAIGRNPARRSGARGLRMEYEIT